MYGNTRQHIYFNGESDKNNFTHGCVLYNYIKKILSKYPFSSFYC